MIVKPSKFKITLLVKYSA